MADGEIAVTYPGDLQGIHEEADTLLAFHALTLARNVMVRASDTYGWVILLRMVGRQIKRGASSVDHIIMDCGTGNDRRYIDVKSISSALEEKQV